MTMLTVRNLPDEVHRALRAHCAALTVNARAAGRGFPTPDGYIAAIAVARGSIVASRDTSPYAAAGVAVIDPWEAWGTA